MRQTLSLLPEVLANKLPRFCATCQAVLAKLEACKKRRRKTNKQSKKEGG